MEQCLFNDATEPLYFLLRLGHNGVTSSVGGGGGGGGVLSSVLDGAGKGFIVTESVLLLNLLRLQNSSSSSSLLTCQVFVCLGGSVTYHHESVLQNISIFLPFFVV